MPSVLITEENRVKLSHEEDSGGQEITSSWRVMKRRSFIGNTLFGTGEESESNFERSRSATVLPSEEHLYEDGELRRSKMIIASAPADEDDTCVVSTAVFEFADSEVYQWEMFTEADRKAIVFTVVRLGNPEISVDIKWTTRNLTCTPEYYGDEGKDMSGIVHFAKGMMITSFEIDFADDPTWNIEAAFQVELLEFQDKNKDTILGTRKICTGYKLNVQKFPNSVDPEDPETTQFALAWAFLYEVWTFMPKRTACSLILNLAPAFHFVINQLILEKTLRVMTKTDDSGLRRRERLMQFLCLIYVLNWAFLHLCKTLNRNLKLGGRAIREFRLNMLTTMTQISDKALQQYDPGECPKILDTQVAEAVSKVFLKAISIWSAFLQLLVQTAFIITIIIRIGGPYGSLYATVLLVAYLVLIITCTNLKQSFLSYQAMEQEDNVVAFASMIEAGRQTVLNYNIDLELSKLFEKMHLKSSQLSFQAASYRDEIVHALRWGTVAVVAFLYIQTSLEVSVSVFVVLLNSTNAIGRALEAVASDAIDVSVGLAAVRKIALLLNAETKRRIKLSFQTPPPEPPPKPLSLFTRLLHCLRNKKSVVHIPRDEAPSCAENHIKRSTSLSDDVLTLIGVEYRVPHAENGAGKKVLGPLYLQIQCGMVISLVDGHERGGVGKGTLCQLLTGELIPSSGLCLIPRGARTCRVPALPLLFDGTLMYNLRMGAHARTIDDTTVWLLCKKLGLSDYLLGDANFDVGQSGEHLTLSDRALVVLARALLSDSDLLFISQSLDLLSPPRQVRAMKVLRQYVQDRGLNTHNIPRSLRRKKLVLVITKNNTVSNLCHQHLVLGNDSKIHVAEYIDHHWQSADSTPTCPTPQQEPPPLPPPTIDDVVLAVGEEEVALVEDRYS